jgi:hypothetical protein
VSNHNTALKIAIDNTPLRESDFKIYEFTVQAIEPPEKCSALDKRCLENVAYMPNGCWLWTGHVDKDGYGKACFRGHGKQEHWRAHRLLYRELIGDIQQEYVLDHLCRNRSCVNPWHMEVVTTLENYRRGDAARGKTGAETNRKKTHCPYGHEYKGWNLIVRDGRRFCRKCMYKRIRAYKRAKGQK